MMKITPYKSNAKKIRERNRYILNRDKIIKEARQYRVHNADKIKKNGKELTWKKN